MKADVFRDKIVKGIKFVTDADYRFLNLASKGYYNSMPDEEYIKRKFHARLGMDLNLENPQTYNEKLQWLKLHDRKSIYTKMVDKYDVKSYVSEIIGNQYVIPTLGVWDRFEDIDFGLLPDRFVIKCTHDSGGLVICKDKSSFDKKEAEQIINQCLKKNYYLVSREWPYKNVKPRIIAEEYREDSVSHDLKDYKFFVFNGKVKSLFIATDRQRAGEETKFDFFDEKFNHLPFTNGHPNAPVLPKRPEKLEEMIYLAEKLGKNIPHVRVDLYEVDKQVLFGEITFSHWGGFTPFDPVEWDYTFGSWIELP